MKQKKIIELSEEFVKLNITQYLLDEFGVAIGLDDLTKKENKYIIKLAYSKVFNIFDDANKKVYIRAITFKNIYSFEYFLNKKIDIKRKLLNENIRSEFINLRNKITLSILDNREIVKKLLHISGVGYLFQKFQYLLMKLVSTDKIEPDEIITKDDKYEKYIKFLTSIGYLVCNKKGEFVATNMVKQILLDKRDKEKLTGDKLINEVVDELLYQIIKEDLDYVVEILQLRIKRFINILSCFYFLKNKWGLTELNNISVDRLHNIYVQLVEKTSKDKLNKTLMQLQYGNVITLTKKDNTNTLLATIPNTLFK